MKRNTKTHIYLLLYIFFLLIPAFFFHLGLLPFLHDEALRANVAMEMIFSGNYIIPTVNGEVYLNKPPLYNWILIIFSKLTGEYNEFTFRLPVVISLFLFALTIYRTQRKEIGRNAAFLAAFAVITCGRILFYDSFRGLLDITFCWVIYLIFWTVYYYRKRNDLYSLFIIAYVLTSVAWLLKGLPAIVFLGITLLAAFAKKGEFKTLFTLAHVSGFGIMVLIIGSYYFAFNSYNSLRETFETLWSESSSRTFMENSFFRSISHLFIFPFEFIYHFAPWTFFVVLFFIKGAFRFMMKNPMIRFFSLVFILNILIYWVSPAIYARYLFMFLPLLFSAVFYILFHYASAKEFSDRYLKPAFIVFMILLFVLVLFAPFIARIDIYEYFWLKYFLIIVLLAPLVYFLLRLKKSWYFVVVAFLLVMRIAFNFFVMPDRVSGGPDNYEKMGASVAGELSAEKELFLWHDTQIHDASTFYIMQKRERILARWNRKAVPGVLFIAEKDKLHELPPHKEYYDFQTRILEKRLSLIEFIQDR